uniref:Uncharacterized protein n=1 Tax=Arion vulgaris TaxID=1028688 RepID=A0A0B6ZEW5_9EUPU
MIINITLIALIIQRCSSTNVRLGDLERRLWEKNLTLGQLKQRLPILKISVLVNALFKLSLLLQN